MMLNRSISFTLCPLAYVYARYPNPSVRRVRGIVTSSHLSNAIDEKEPELFVRLLEGPLLF